MKRRGNHKSSGSTVKGRKVPNINSLLKKDYFFKHYEVLQHALTKNSLFRDKTYFKKPITSIPLENVKKKKQVKDSEENNPAEELDNDFNKYEKISERVMKEFKTYNKENKFFSTTYKLFKNQSDKNFRRKTSQKLLQKSQSIGNIKSLKIKEKNPNNYQTLFKISPLLLTSPKDIKLKFLGAKEKIIPSDLKYIQFLSNIGDYLDYIAIKRESFKDNEYANVKLKNSRYFQQHNKKLEKEYHKRKTQEYFTNKYEIEKSKNIISSTKNTIEAFENDSLSIGPLSTRKNKKMDLTSSTGLFSPRISQTFRKSSYGVEKKSSVSSFSQNQNEGISRDISIIKKTPVRERLKSISYNSKKELTNTLDTNKEQSFKNAKSKEEMYNGLKNETLITPSSMKTIEKNLNIETKKINQQNYQNQVFHLVRNTVNKAGAYNIKKEFSKIYENKIPYKTKEKIEDLEESEKIIQQLDFNFFKCLIKSNINNE